MHTSFLQQISFYRIDVCKWCYYFDKMLDCEGCHMQFLSNILGNH